jgi:SAM-dependent methyltransferase/uncharacterized protein YbaR (Trm112 family)
MWAHAHPSIRCPLCKDALGFQSVDVDAAWPDDLTGTAPDSSGEDSWIEAGALVCTPCSAVFPVHQGVPILLKYPTAMAEAAIAGWPAPAREQLERRGLALPTGQPPRGEEFVSASFSTEWSAYDYGDTLWTAPVEDRLITFRGECGLGEDALAGQRFIEIGCGLGITTNEATKAFAAEAWGVDLSVAVFRAANHFRDNRNLHFVQASVFDLPFAEGHFDFLYSHGVLHHTFSTHEAIRHAARVLRDGAGMYVWLYGHDDVNISSARKIAYHVEEAIRPMIAKMPPGLATATLLPTIPAYQLASWLGTRSGTHKTIYSAKEALHAARDRFTPLFAHRHDVPEVSGWLEEAGFARVSRVVGDEVSDGWSLAIDRNVAVRGYDLHPARGDAPA